MDTVYDKLREYGEILETPYFFIELADKLARLYSEYFTEEKILNLFNSSFFLSSSRLPLDKFSSEEKKYLIYKEKIKVEVMNANFEINLQNQVENLKIKDCLISNLQQELPQVLNLLQSLNIKIEDLSFNEDLFRLSLSSLIYQFAYIRLKEQVHTTIDSVRTGMFKNAYYNIIELKLLKYFPHNLLAEKANLHV